MIKHDKKDNELRVPRRVVEKKKKKGKKGGKKKKWGAFGPTHNRHRYK